MSNAELYDHLMKTNPEFARIYGTEKNVIQNNGEKVSFDESIKAEEGGVFDKAFAWVARGSMDIKDKQDKILDSAVGVIKKAGIFIILAICVFIVIKFNLLKDIKKTLKELK